MQREGKKPLTSISSRIVFRSPHVVGDQWIQRLRHQVLSKWHTLGLFDCNQHRLRISGHRHRGRLLVYPILQGQAVSAHLLQERDDLSRLLLAQDSTAPG